MLQIGPLAIRWYGLLIALGVVLGTAWAVRAAKARGLDADKLLDSAPLLVLAGIVGARLVYVLTSPGHFFGPGGNPWDAVKVWQGGISIHGGVIGIMIALYFYARAKDMNMWAMLDVLTPVGALGIIGGRIGNFMNGSDTGGRLTDSPLGFVWPEVGTQTFGAFGRFIFGDVLWQFGPPVCQGVAVGDPCRVHLTPLYGMLVGIILLFIIRWALRRSRTPGFTFWQFVLWYSVLRSVLEEPFRDNPLFWQVYLNEPAGVGLFTLTQLMSIPLILIAAYQLLIRDPDEIDRKERLALKARGRLQ
jgi:phosphatidylglycerol:prolipoprotein diacylglycerol transferase